MQLIIMQLKLEKRKISTQRAEYLSARMHFSIVYATHRDTPRQASNGDCSSLAALATTTEQRRRRWQRWWRLRLLARRLLALAVVRRAFDRRARHRGRGLVAILYVPPPAAVAAAAVAIAVFVIVGWRRRSRASQRQLFWPQMTRARVFEFCSFIRALILQAIAAAIHSDDRLEFT